MLNEADHKERDMRWNLGHTCLSKGSPEKDDKGTDPKMFKWEK